MPVADTVKPDTYATWSELPTPGRDRDSIATFYLSERLGAALDELDNAEVNQQQIMTTFYDVFNDVPIEFLRQYNKWGNQYHHIPAWEMITGEEWGEAIAAMNKAIYGPSTENYNEAIKETVEMIACAIQLIHELRRQRDGVGEEDAYTSQA